MTTNIKQDQELTRGFFQLLAEGRTDSIKPVVQIMNSRFTNDQTGIRLRLNDGLFSYATIILRDKGLEKFKSLGIDKSQAVIKLLEYCSNVTLKDGVKRIHLTITDFDLLLKETSIIGSPIPHSGNAEEHLGLKVENIGQAPLKESNTQAPSREVSKVVKSIKAETSGGDAFVVPIISISPYLMQWKICGVVTDKSPVREINTPRGASKVFNFSITDKEGTEIKITCFGDMVNQLSESVQLSSSYYIKGNNKAIKTANKRYNSTGHEYEITMRNDVEVFKCEDTIQLPAQKINRVSLSKIKMFPGESVDVIAIVDSMEETSDINTKNGVTKRKIISLLDESASLVRLTAWGDSCDEFDGDLLHKPIILKNVSVNEFNGTCALTFNFRSKIIPSDGSGIVQDLSDWYEKERGNIQINSSLPSGAPFGRNVTIHAAAVNDIHDSDRKGGYYNVVARIARFRENLVYKACAQKDCKKKVTVQDDQYYCSKCDISTTDFKWALMVVLEIYDHSGSHWLTMFDNKAEQLLKRTSDEVGTIIENHGDGVDGHNVVTSGLINTIHNFNVKSRIEMFNEAPIAKWVGVDVRPVKLSEYAKYLEAMCKEAEEFCSKNNL